MLVLITVLVAGSSLASWWTYRRWAGTRRQELADERIRALADAHARRAGKV